MTYNDFFTLCTKRRSIRFFADKPVAKDDVLKLLSLACLAPSVENAQPWHFYVIYSKDMRKQMIDASCYGNFIEGAGVFIVVSCDVSAQQTAPEPMWNPKELEYSCMSAMENMLLGATAMGLGSCWVSLHHGTAHDVLGLPRNRIIVGGVMVGYYKTGEEEPSGEHQRKPLGTLYTLYE